MQGLKSLVPVLALVLGSAGLVAPAPAAEVGSYLNGGVGLESRHAMLAQRGPYNLRLAFAQARSGEYLTGLHLTLQRAGEPAMHFADSGPLFYVRLKPGSYRITADYQGTRRTLSVNVGPRAVDRVLYWP